jgi:hypothetical protein
MRLTTSPSKDNRPAGQGVRASTARQHGYTFAEVLSATAILGFVSASLYCGLGASFSVVQTTRENVRATQIMLQKVEAIRLFTWSQLGDTTNYLTTDFTEDYDPLGTTNGTSGVKYRCFVSASTPAVGDVADAYRTNMSTVTVSVYWTNYIGAKSIVHNRSMQTRVARNGMQNYIWGAQ